MPSSYRFYMLYCEWQLNIRRVLERDTDFSEMLYYASKYPIYEKSPFTRWTNASLRNRSHLLWTVKQRREARNTHSALREVRTNVPFPSSSQRNLIIISIRIIFAQEQYHAFQFFIYLIIFQQILSVFFSQILHIFLCNFSYKSLKLHFNFNTNNGKNGYVSCTMFWQFF